MHLYKYLDLNEHRMLLYINYFTFIQLDRLNTNETKIELAELAA